MNYYNPYFYNIPSSIVTPKTGLFSRIFGNSGITFGGILNGTQRALNFANQAIPLVKQVKPMIGNARTMFKVMNEFKRSETPTKRQNNISNVDIKEKLKTDENNYINTSSISTIEETNGPTFFI